MPSRIAHFTDLHFTERTDRIPWRALLSKRLVGWINLRFLGRQAALAGAPEITRALLEDLHRVRPDHILFTGDVSSLSLPSEFEAARGVLDPLLDDDRVTGIPGNHDVYVGAAAREGFFERWFGDWVRTDIARDDLPPELRGAYPYPLLRHIGDEVALLCLRDVRPTAPHDSSGHVSELQLAALEHLLDGPALRQRVRILALHYGLRRHDGSPDTYLHRLRNADRVLALAEKKRVHLVVHGHIHRRFVHAAATVSPVAIANPGALAYSGLDRAYHIYTVDGGEIFLEARRYDDATARFQPWPDAPGSGRIAPAS